MTKSKPWPPEDERKLNEWVTSGIGVDVIVFGFGSKYSKNGVMQELLDLGLISKEEEARKNHSSSTVLKLSAELPSNEEKLKILLASLKALDSGF